MTRPSRHFARLLPLLAVAGLGGCALIMNGTTQSLSFASSPSRATISVDGQVRGTTPAVLLLSRASDHTIRITLDGFQPFETTITRHLSAWALEDILTLNVIGIAIDASSGGMYALTPEQVAGHLTREAGAGLHATADGISVVLIQRPDSTWPRIGTLRRQ